MANLKSSKKNIKSIATKTPQNNMYKAKVKNAIKNCEKAILENDYEKATEYLNLVQKNIDIAVGKKVISKNKADRQKSRLNKKVKELK